MLPVDLIRAEFGAAAQEKIVLAPYTSARIGGPADVLITVKSADELAKAAQFMWTHELPYYVLGGGSNILVSDAGFRGVVILNKAKEARFQTGDQPSVWCESGVVFSNLANRCASKGLGGLEWGAAVPGTIGGAVFGNAGAFGGETSMNLIWAELLTVNGREKFTAAQMGYAYRTSVLKRREIKALVLSAELALQNSTKAEASAKIAEFSERRKSTQPPGASMGSMFKNPTGDYAGRLIEAAGLKGSRIGNAEISAVHGNFFVNHGATKASDITALIRLAQTTVLEKLGVQLELEIELL
ncbi:MAG: UDP-N-acetylmuramate dehydrogenase [Anaerolineales bacterium]|nr:UDP-N-acetylmuramate dehydrogenase [Anaerolineales bacterium]MCZ2122991.1 UDP-N-acetylmuramate dehydrogenase [Anaerolineales bacterium]